MNKNNVFFLSLATFITIVAWIGFNIYHNYNTSTISETENVQIAPIKATFDTQAIDSVLKRKKVLPIFEATSSSQTLPTASSEAQLQPSTQQPPTTQITPAASSPPLLGT